MNNVRQDDDYYIFIERKNVLTSLYEAALRQNANFLGNKYTQLLQIERSTKE